VKLTKDVTWIVLGQADGRTFQVRVYLCQSCPICSGTWPEEHDLWGVAIGSE